LGFFFFYLVFSSFLFAGAYNFTNQHPDLGVAPEAKYWHSTMKPAGHGRSANGRKWDKVVCEDCCSSLTFNTHVE